CNIPSTWSNQTPHKSGFDDRPHARADVLLLWLTHTAGLRVTELAQLETSPLPPSNQSRSKNAMVAG
ncbi:Integrase, partial [Pseudomonas coronafaciens pv. porri]